MNLLMMVPIAIALLFLASMLLIFFLPPSVDVTRIEIILKIVAPIVAILPVVVGLLEYVGNQRVEAANAIRTEYIQATQLLMEQTQEKQLGGIAAVAQLAATDSERTWLMTDSLSSFIRLHAQRNDLGNPLEHGFHELARVRNPPCSKQAPVEFHYNYSTCVPHSELNPLYRTNPPVQAALAALANRSRKLEDLSSPPARFETLVESMPRTPSSSETPRTKVIRYIDSNWWRQDRRESNDQLINEVQTARGSEFINIQTRPWLNLSYADLRGAEAESAWFEGGNLRQTNLTFSRLAGANLAKSTLAGAWIVGANLFGTDLRGADLQFADVRGSDLGHAKLSRAWMSGAKFSRANFWQADLEGAYLIATDMTDLETASGANLDQIVAYRSNFSDANVAGDFNFGVCMRNAFLREAKFDRANLRGVDLSGSDLRDARLVGAKLLSADLRNTRLAEADLTGADLSQADLRGVDLSHTRGVPKSLIASLADNETKLPARWPHALTSALSNSPARLTRDCKRERSPAMKKALQGSEARVSAHLHFAPPGDGPSNSRIDNL